VLANGLSCALVLHLAKNVRPAVFEEVERSLSIKSEHGEPIGGGHTVTEKLNSMTWGSIEDLR